MGKFDKSNELFEEASKYIPGGIPGHQSPLLLVFGKSPCFVERTEGARFWDVDGNEYIDYMCAYGPMVLGYNHPKVEEAVQKQRDSADLGNLPTPRSIELAKKLTELIPIADWAIFGKNGSDVTTYALRVARSHTGRNKVIQVEGAYHGIGAWCTPFLPGITPEDRANQLTFEYNDTEGFLKLAEENKDDLAGVIVSPFRHDAFHDQEMPAPGFLETIRKTCGDMGSVLVVDDVRAGFRMNMGGSLESFGVKPDLICFSKAMGNGYAISSCVGKDDLKSSASNVFFTGSFFSSAAPIAASIATLEEMEETGAIDIMYERGEMLKDGIMDQADAYGQEVNYTGPETIPYLSFAHEDGADRVKLFCEECYERGVFFHPFHNWFISAAHTEEDIKQTLDVTDAAFKRVKEEMG